MSDADDRRAAMCAGKHKFASMGAARLVARQQGRREQNVNAYRCPVCRCFHIGTPAGHTPMRRADARAEREAPYRYENDFDRRRK